MAREEGFPRPPYRNLKEYQDYKRQGAAILNLPSEAIETEADDPDAIAFAGDITDLPE
jgi:glutathione peroxidase-family protein